MKRFVRVYLTILFVVAVLANLALIVVYGQNFIFQGAEVCNDAVQVCSNGFNAGVLTTQLVVVNGVIFGFFGLVWFVLRHIQGLWEV